MSLSVPFLVDWAEGQPCEADEECHLGIGDRFRSNNQISFILAILRIQRNDKLSSLYEIDR